MVPPIRHRPGSAMDARSPRLTRVFRVLDWGTISDTATVVMRWEWAPAGGYPFYGGPGYPHCGPRLRRLGKINPFPYFGGPGYPSFEHPNFFGGIGPLVPDQPVVTLVDERGSPIGASATMAHLPALPLTPKPSSPRSRTGRGLEPELARHSTCAPGNETSRSSREIRYRVLELSIVSLPGILLNVGGQWTRMGRGRLSIPGRCSRPIVEANMTIPKYTAEDLKKLPLRAIVALAARCAGESSNLPCLRTTSLRPKAAGWQFRALFSWLRISRGASPVPPANR